MPRERQCTDDAGVAPQLPLATYRLRFTAETSFSLSNFPGSAWRGAFGHALKRTVCVTRLRNCADCMLFRSCVYPAVFESPVPAGATKMRRYSAIPHPFVLSPRPLSADAVAPGAIVETDLTLFGRVNAHLPYLVHALGQAGEQGLGPGRGRLLLQSVRRQDTESSEWARVYDGHGQLSVDPPQLVNVPPVPAHVHIAIDTPLRLKRDGSLVSPERFRFRDLFSNLLRRISMLTQFYTDTPLETDFASLVRDSEDVVIHGASLRWREGVRYSSRQQTAMKMGGLIGSFSMDGRGAAPFWPYLWLGQWTHAGHGTSMGLGRYRIESQASLPDTILPARRS